MNAVKLIQGRIDHHQRMIDGESRLSPVSREVVARREIFIAELREILASVELLQRDYERYYNEAHPRVWGYDG